MPQNIQRLVEGVIAKPIDNQRRAIVLSCKIRAPHADTQNSGSAQSPVVIRRGPLCTIEPIFSVTDSTETPANPSIRLSFTLNVNNDGTGSSIECQDLTIRALGHSSAINSFFDRAKTSPLVAP
jgi:hypothetical protein